ncbi:hypothetical protein XM52_21170 [Roseovarius indicus]|uniref:Uncharacterized protein n=1 Tax=Roseovarius indicus TaxID=540747 RepID=A0A0T5P453_9RHOB|nr:hypothetical protein XM52_21170 [Roseovarius indicus]
MLGSYAQSPPNRAPRYLARRPEATPLTRRTGNVRRLQLLPPPRPLLSPTTYFRSPDTPCPTPIPTTATAPSPRPSTGSPPC